MNRITAKEVLDEVVTDEVLARAIETGRRRFSERTCAVSVRYIAAEKALNIAFADHTQIVMPLAYCTEFAGLTQPELRRITVDCGGSALCLEERDIHVSVLGLIAKNPVFEAIARHIVAAGNGRKTTAAKSAAARANGAKGGRPRKILKQAA